MTDFERTTEMSKEIGELKAYVNIAKEIIEKAEFAEYSYEGIRQRVWLDAVKHLNLNME